MLERELLGSARTIIDAHSNNSLVPPTQYATYRAPYAAPAPSPYIATNTSYSYHVPVDSYEPRKALTDVGMACLCKQQGFSLLFSLVTRTDSSSQTRSRQERCSDPRIDLREVSSALKMGFCR